MTRFLYLVAFSVFSSLGLTSNVNAQIEKIDPPFWWTDMPVEQVQIQLYGPNLGLHRAAIDYPGV